MIAFFASMMVASVLVCGTVGYVIGAKKQRGMEGGALGGLMGPLGIVAIYLKEPYYDYHCPYCKTGVPEKAVACRACGKDFRAS